MPDTVGARKTFVSYSHSLDQDAADRFREFFGNERDVFIDKSQREDISDRQQETIKEYIKEQIRDSSVTVVLIGRETGGRKWVDWEIYYSLRHDNGNYRNGLLGILIPNKQHWMPDRLKKNINNNNMGKIIEWPREYRTLVNKIEEVYQLRNNSPDLRDPVRRRNSS